MTTMSTYARSWDAAGDLDRVHLHAIETAHKYHRELDYNRLRSFGATLAVAVGGLDGVEAAGRFVMAFMSTIKALTLEERDASEVFAEVAKEWWADPRHAGLGATRYGAPWSPVRPDATS